MTKSAKPISSNVKKRSGVTLIEILIVTVIIGLMASLSFPAFKILQQREKERRLHKILSDVRAAIAGSKSQQSTTSFTEGYRTYVRVRGLQAIDDAHTVINDPTGAIASGAIASFVGNLADQGLGYPLTPSALIYNPKFPVASITVATATTGSVNIKIDRRFLRSVPPHPFKNWYPTAEWYFRRAKPIDPVSENNYLASGSWAVTDVGITDIVSRGAGMGLDGSNTDDW